VDAAFQTLSTRPTAMTRTNHNSFAEHERANTRLTILRTLMRTSGYMTNLEVLQPYLKELALAAPFETLRQDFQMLKELNCVEIWETQGVHCIRLTRYGQEVAEGMHIVEGVLHPGPDCPY
jgi:hypothetical protein